MVEWRGKARRAVGSKVRDKGTKVEKTGCIKIDKGQSRRARGAKKEKRNKLTICIVKSSKASVVTLMQIICGAEEDERVLGTTSNAIMLLRAFGFACGEVAADAPVEVAA